MTPDTALAIGILVIAGAAAVAIGLFLRPSGRHRHGTPSPASIRPPSGTRPGSLLDRIESAERLLKTVPPILSTYDGATRLQRAQAAAKVYLVESSSKTRLDPIELLQIDTDALARAIVTAWIGEDEPMVRVPIMKLGDIKLEHNEPAWADMQAKMRLEEVNRSRAAMNLPPLVTLDPLPPPTPLHPRRPNDRKLGDEA